MALHWRKLCELPCRRFRLNNLSSFRGAAQASLRGNPESILMVAEMDSRFRPQPARAARE
jgi:hypothetical protein